MSATTSSSPAETQIRALLADWAAGLRAKNVARATAPYADDAVMFILAPPLQFKPGVNAPGAAGVEEWFKTWQGDIGYESRELTIRADAEVAFAHHLVHYYGTRADGQPADYWARETLGLRYLNGRWQISHQHESVPFYMDGSQRAALDLKP